LHGRAASALARRQRRSRWGGSRRRCSSGPTDGSTCRWT
jgi:hypothetical protein